jgi:hypothetical protein
MGAAKVKPGQGGINLGFFTSGATYWRPLLKGKESQGGKYPYKW